MRIEVKNKLYVTSFYLFINIIMHSHVSLASPSITKGPYLQNVTTNSIVIMWETDTPSIGTIECNNVSFSESAASSIHEVEISNLTPNTNYSYRITSGEAVGSNIKLIFTTMPETPASFNFAVVGDTQTPFYDAGGNPITTDLDAIIRGIYASSPDIFLHLGDLVTAGGSSSDWNTFFTHSEELLSTAPMFPTPGNHEYINDSGATHFFNYFSLPKNVDKELGRYTFVYGNIRFISLDTQSLTTEQDDWLKLTLANTIEDFIVVYFHQPPVTSNKIDLNAYVRDNWIPLFQQYGVNLVLSGHTHNYQRYVDSTYKTVYIVSGGGNSLFDSLNPNYKPPRGILKKAERTNTIHFDTVDVKFDTTERSLTFKAYDANLPTASPFDSFKIGIPQYLYVNSVVTSTVAGTKSLVYGKAVVTILDEYENPVSKAKVEGNWTGLGDDNTYSVTTDDNGIATFQTKAPFKKQNFSFKVTNVIATDMKYVP
jgi:hypothetical protein